MFISIEIFAESVEREEKLEIKKIMYMYIQNQKCFQVTKLEKKT